MVPRSIPITVPIGSASSPLHTAVMNREEKKKISNVRENFLINGRDEILEPCAYLKAQQTRESPMPSSTSFSDWYK